MVVVQAMFRGWALHGSFFYTDDYRLLWDAGEHGLDGSYLVKPFDSQFMPLGRLVAWVVADNGHLNWQLAATITLALQVAAALACLAMLVSLFGPRWGILPPLGIYLTSVVTMPSFMWWAAAINQVPWQLAFFLSVTAWVAYLRNSSRRWLAATTVVIMLGLACYVKTVLILPVLVVLMLGWFSSGSLLDRIRDTVRRYWPAAVTLSVLPGAFAVYYLVAVPQVFSDSEEMRYSVTGVAGDLAKEMLGSSFMTGVLGGPWRWLNSNPPVGYADPPAWIVVLSWVAVLGTGVVLFLLRRRTGRAFLLLGGYAVLAYLLVLTSRARVAGGSIGTDLRYLTDVIPVLALAVALASLELRGARESSHPRRTPLMITRLPAWIAPVMALAVIVSGVWNTVRYVDTWHHDNPGADYVDTIRDDLPSGRKVDMAEQVVPPTVIPGFSFPYNSTRRFLPLISDEFRFPDATGQLVVLDDGGHLRKALIRTGVTSLPGPTGGCGWLVEGPATAAVPLSNPTVDYEWWLRISYVGSRASDVTVAAGESTVHGTVHSGLGSLYVKVRGSLDEIRISGLDDGDALCVDKIEVGTPVPGGAL
ncbi:hypothetical protein ASG90_08645 [Nocardioides sp. Soil797]|nr:hypothetical protein ASG90_08645 [Nocardioides sp. Soil797]